LDVFPNHDDDNDDDDDDDDDDSFLSLYSKLGEDAISTEAAESSPIIISEKDGKIDVRNKKVYVPVEHVEENNEKKRVAPLSFVFKEILAKPALHFDKSNITLDETNNPSKPALKFDIDQMRSNENDFVSPLETALINQVDHLTTDDMNMSGDDDDDDECVETSNGNDNNENLKVEKPNVESGSYYLSSWLPTFLYSPKAAVIVSHEVHVATKAETNTEGGIDDLTSKKKAILGSHQEESGTTTKEPKPYISSSEVETSYKSILTSNENQSNNNPETKPLLDATYKKSISISNENQSNDNLETNPLLEATFNKSISTSNEDQFNNNLETNLLLEAKNVMQRIETVSSTLSHAIESGSRSSTVTKRRKTSKIVRMSTKAPESRILKKIESQKNSDMTMDHRNHPGTPWNTPWNRLLILEELGTASSVIVLLIPYIAFLVALVLDDSSFHFWTVTSPPLYTREMCSSIMTVNNTNAKSSNNLDVFNIPLCPLPNMPCSYKFQLYKEDGLLTYIGRYINMNETSFASTMESGVAVTSGPITDIPVLSDYLFADLNFNNISTVGVSLFTKGKIYQSSIIMQKEIGEDPTSDSKWFPISISKPKKLDPLCSRQEEGNMWSCSSPGNVDVIFSRPATSVLTGGPLRIDTLLSLISQPIKIPSNHSTILSNITELLMPSKVVSNDPDDIENILSHADISDPNHLLLNLARSASYYVTHRKGSLSKILIGIRLGTLIFTCIFMLSWLWSMGIDGFFGFKSDACCCLLPRTCHIAGKGNKSTDTSPWWESPWVLFPERRYLLLMMICLLLVQNPLLTYIYFKPSLYGSSRMRIIADTMIGIGIHGVLCLWLCLMQGLRYHTAEMARKRAENQKKQLQVRSAISYLSSSVQSTDSTYGSLSGKNIFDFYDEHGDFDGNGRTSWVNLRLKHDPCGDNWPDFLLPKLFLFAIGVSSVLVSTLSRFPDETHHALGSFSLIQYHDIYTASSLLQTIVLGFWAILIFRAALKTGEALKMEPFISTRPVQLAFRILMSMIMLGAASVIIMFSAHINSLNQQWISKQHSPQTQGLRGSDSPFHGESKNYTTYSAIKVIFRVILHVSERIPYVGTASCLGPGEIFFFTVSTLTVAFIFLPSTDFILSSDSYLMEEQDDSGKEISAVVHRRYQRREKRMVVTLARYTHTWRIFPLPIERHRNLLPKKINSAEHYQLDGYFFRYHSNIFGPGTIYKENYIAVFCIETALWLLECSWQTYYSATEFKTDDFAPGKMNLGSVGLKLEADIFHEETDTRAYVASNLTPQVDGDIDSVIVVAFRGTTSITNLKTNVKWHQESLLDSILTGANVKPKYEFTVSNNIDTEHGTVTNISFVKNDEKSDRGLKNGSIGLLKVAPLTRQAFPCVHCGFLHAYKQVRDEIMTTILKVFERQLKKSVKQSGNVCLKIPKIYITGHSLGGALAQLCALDIACNVEIAFAHHMPRGFNFEIEVERQKSLRPPIAVYSFGQPRVGNHAFARFYKAHVPHSFRVVSEGDAITSIPFATLCKGVALYKHAGLEVTLEETSTGNILVGPTVVETMFRFSKVRTSLQAHLMENYRKGIQSALTQDELQEFYRNRCSYDHSFRDGYNTSDLIPDWVTHVRNNNLRDERNSEVLRVDWTDGDIDKNGFDDLPDWAR